MARKILGLGTTTVVILSSPIPMVPPMTVECNGSDIQSTMSIEEELIEAHMLP